MDLLHPFPSSDSRHRRVRASRPLLVAVGSALVTAVSVGAFLAPASTSAAATPTVQGQDVSWPQCPAGTGSDVGGGYGKGYGNPMPPRTTGFIVIGLTDGLPFTTNHCLSDQVAFATANRIPVGAYTMAAYPTPAQLLAHGATGPQDGSTTQGRLFNTGYSMAHSDLASMAAAGLQVPFVWIDVESRNVQNWPTGTSAKTTSNRAVLSGFARGYADAGVGTGWYSYASGWAGITGAWRDGAPMWQTAGSSVPAGYAGARAVCSMTSFNGGPIYLGQRVSGSSDLDATCPALPSLGTLFSVAGQPAPQPPGTVATPSATPTATAATTEASLAPVTLARSWSAPGAAIVFSSWLGTTQSWTATLTNACTATELRTWRASGTGRYALRWDGRDSAGAPAPTGLYRFSLTSGNLRRSTTVEITTAGSHSVAGCGLVRHYGNDRYATSVDVGAVAAPGSRTVVLAAGEGSRLADGLVAAPLARLLNAPLLLTATATLPSRVRADLVSRQVGTVYLVGGTGSVSEAVAAQVRGLGASTVARVSGKDRYATSAAVATTMARLGAAGTHRAWVAAGADGRMVDALAAGGVAAASGEPILLTAPDRVPVVVAQAIQSLAITRTLVAGGTGVVPAAVVAALPGPTRVAGADRYDTAARIAALGSADAGAVLASGVDGQLLDALSGGSLGLPVVLAPGSGLPPGATAWLSAARPATVRVLGGPAVIPPVTLTSALTALGRSYQ